MPKITVEVRRTNDNRVMKKGYADASWTQSYRRQLAEDMIRNLNADSYYVVEYEERFGEPQVINQYDLSY